MKKYVLLFLLISIPGFSQEHTNGIFQTHTDSIVYDKNTKIEHQRSFNDDLKKKYTDKEFVYVDDVKEPERNSATIDSGFLNGFLYFMQYIFPFMLGIVSVLIILKTFLGTDNGFWNFKKLPQKIAAQKMSEDEDIHETNFDALLQASIHKKHYRLATRYYYLSLLKKLSDTKEIEYHKDKTNTAYVSEIQNKEIKSQFSEVSYIYSHIWYGEFPLDSHTFKTIEKKYTSIFKSIC